jgi:methionyl-tRNA formyltransferase
MKILFMGTPEFAKISLQYLVENKYDVVGVITQPDKPVGRKMILTSSPVKEYALKENITVYQPETLRNEEFFELMKNIAPDIIVVVAYGQILPKNILEYPKYGCVNVHASLLPKYRGAAPINAAIMNGEKITGITTIFMEDGIDTGDMILKEETEIGRNETYGELHDRLAQIGGKVLVETLNQIQNGTAKREKQLVDGVSNVKKINNDICEIDWNKPAKEINNKIRGLSPIPTAFTWLNGKKLKIYRTHFKEGHQNAEEELWYGEVNGEVIGYHFTEKTIEIKACDNIIRILELQLEGEKRMSATDFFNGRKIKKGMILGDK